MSGPNGLVMQRNGIAEVHLRKSQLATQREGPRGLSPARPPAGDTGR